MKRLLVLSLVAILSVGLLSVGAFAQPTNPPDESDSTYVEWVIDAPMQCSLSITAHTGIDFGTLNQVNTTYSASGSGSTITGTNGAVNSSNRTVETSSNCKYDVYVDVTSVNAPISATSVLNDFEIRLANTSGLTTTPHSNFKSGNSIGSWKNFNWSGQVKLGEAGDNGTGNYANPDNSYWVMDYAYTTDYSDQNAAYTINLEYTASVQ